MQVANVALQAARQLGAIFGMAVGSGGTATGGVAGGVDGVAADAGAAADAAAVGVGFALATLAAPPACFWLPLADTGCVAGSEGTAALAFGALGAALGVGAAAFTLNTGGAGGSLAAVSGAGG
jgi:hypothetical protein